MPYGEALPQDSASKKFVAVLTDNGGVNVFAALAGANYRTQNAEVVADLIVQLTTTGGAGATIGATGDAAVPTGTGTISGKLRAIAEALGATSGAAVITDAAGTIQQYARGIVVLLVNLLSRWPAALGQTTMANSFPVTLSSNQSALPITDNAGSLTVDSPQLPASLGQKAKAAAFAVTLSSDEDVVTTQGDLRTGSDRGIAPLVVRYDAGTIALMDDGEYGPFVADEKGRVRMRAAMVDQLPAALGQMNKAGSVSMTLASDEDALPVTDNGGALSVDDNAGSLTVDSPQLPATLGQKAMAASAAVVVASDQTPVAVKTAIEDNVVGDTWLMPQGGIYEANPVNASADGVDEVDDGDMAQMRATARRAQVTAPDGRRVYVNASTIDEAGDLTMNTNPIGDWGPPDTASFGFASYVTGATLYIRIPMLNWDDVSIVIHNGLDVALTAAIQSNLVGNLTGDADAEIVLDTAAISAGTSLLYSSRAGGAGVGSNVRSVPALAGPRSYIVVKLTVASNAGSGSVVLAVARRA